MNFYVGNDLFEFRYYPFFRISKEQTYHKYGMRLPSGHIEKILVFDIQYPVFSLREYSAFLIKNYVLEDDDMLTTRAMKIKKDLMELLTNETRQRIVKEIY